jgi:tRNA isopentenyl-2-thiomethyl-A-37 hydroxylase MiaE
LKLLQYELAQVDLIIPIIGRIQIGLLHTKFAIADILRKREIQQIHVHANRYRERLKAAATGEV